MLCMILNMTTTIIMETKPTMVIGLSRQMEKKYLEIVYTFLMTGAMFSKMNLKPKMKKKEESRKVTAEFLSFMIRMDKKMQNIA